MDQTVQDGLVQVRGSLIEPTTASVAVLQPIRGRYNSKVRQAVVEYFSWKEPGLLVRK